MTTTAAKEMAAMKKELAFIMRAVSAGHIDEETIAEIYKAAQSARASLEAVELELTDDETDELADAA